MAVPLLLTSKSLSARVEPWNWSQRNHCKTHSNKLIYTVQIIILSDIESQRNLVFIALWLGYSRPERVCWGMELFDLSAVIANLPCDLALLADRLRSWMPG